MQDLRLIDESELIRGEVLERMTHEFINKIIHCQAVNREAF